MSRRDKDHKPRLYSIPPAAPFLSTLVDALMSGRLIPGFGPETDALALAGVTIYVPTRRAARALQAEFVARAQQNALLLPRILPLGDIEEDQFTFDQPGDHALDLGPVIGSLERQLLLTRMIRQWTAALDASSDELFENEAIVVPSSISDAAWLANDLATLMDSVATEEADWSLLEKLVPDDHADWWQLTLAFLKIATSSWPEILRERGAMDVASRRGILLHRQAETYRRIGSSGPVIAAGSTGSIPATANLLKTIAEMEDGAVVLPGLDRDMDDEVWNSLTVLDAKITDRQMRTSHEQAAAPGHPQYGLKKLLDNIGVTRSQVEPIGGIEESSSGYARLRERFVSLSLEPSEATDHWPEFRKRLSDEMSVRAFSGVSMIDAANERQEALAIALAMREALTIEKKTAALITPDRVLARRVSTELKRFGIEVDDSAGIPLMETAQGSFVRLVLAVTLAPVDPVLLLSLLKHPVAQFGMEPSAVKMAVETFEIGVIRGNIAPPVPGEYQSAVTAAKMRISSGTRLSTAQKRLSQEGWVHAEQLAISMDRALAPLFELAGQTLPLDALVEKTIHALEHTAADENAEPGNLYSDEAGEALAGFFGELYSKSPEFGEEVEANEWPSLYNALLASRPVRPHRKTHSRLSIWGPLEARLQQVDRIILGGLNEGTWPAAAKNDPFLNRPMKNTLALEPPERRIGLAAHDIQMALGTAEVIISRSKRADNAPTVPSRWLQRLLTLAGDDAKSAMTARGKVYLDWAEAIDHPAGGIKENIQTISRPEPKPPLDRRPVKLSITEIETWIRDPYAIYAKHVLKLQPVEPVRREADARERGNLYHDIFENFSRDVMAAKDANTLSNLIEIARQHFAATGLPENITAFWWPRFLEIADEFIKWEHQRANDIAATFVELPAKLEVDSSGFTIIGRADRIDLSPSGGHTIIDYKTGTNPAVKQANILLAPQLPLEGALALKGGFEGIESTQIDGLFYVRLRASGGFKSDELAGGKEDFDAHTLSLKAWTALQAIIAAYQNPNKGYLSRARPFKQGDVFGDYDHLARVMEWAVEDEENEAFQ